MPQSRTGTEGWLLTDPTSGEIAEAQGKTPAHWASRDDWERHMRGDHITSPTSVFDPVLAAPPENSVLIPLED